MKTITLKQITDTVLPGLRAIFGDDDVQITKSLKDQLSTMTVTGEDGKPLGDVEFVVTGQTIKTETKASQTTATDENRIAEIVGKSMTAAFAKQKTEIKADLDGVIRGISGGTPRNDDAKMWGWKHAGEFGAAVIKSVKKGQITDERLLKSFEADGIETKASLATYVNESVGEEGGFAIPPDIDTTIRRKVMGGDTLASKCNQNPTSRNVVIRVTDETTPWQTTGGVLAFWEGEADVKPQSKIKLKEQMIRLNKLVALVPITDEAMDDSPSLINYINVKAPEKISFKLDLAIVSGSGAGQPLGILNSPCLISVAKVTSQTAATITGINVAQMLLRLYEGMSPNTIFIANPDTRVQLELLMKQGINDDGTLATAWGVVPPWTMYDMKRDMSIGGKQVIFHHAAATVGAQGDVILGDMSQYDLYTRVGGIKADTSIHLWFDQDVTALRFVMRVAGQPGFSAPIQPRVGSTTYSPFVVLDVR